MHCKLQIYLEGKFINIEAIIDTGNFLRDPITKTPVIVVEKEVLRGTLPDNIINNLSEIISGKDINIGDYISKIRIIPFSSLGKENGLLLGIKANNVCINHNEENLNLNNVIIGIYNGTLSKSNKYSALVGLNLLEEDLITQ